MNETLQGELRRGQRVALVCAVVGGLGCVAAVATGRRAFFVAYLVGWLFWLGLTMGCLLLTMIHHLTAGRWGEVTRRFMEAGLAALPAMALLFAPILFRAGGVVSVGASRGSGSGYSFAEKGGICESVGLCDSIHCYFRGVGLDGGAVAQGSLQQDGDSGFNGDAKVASFGRGWSGDLSGDGDDYVHRLDTLAGAEVVLDNVSHHCVHRANFVRAHVFDSRAGVGATRSSLERNSGRKAFGSTGKSFAGVCVVLDLRELWAIADNLLGQFAGGNWLVFTSHRGELESGGDRAGGVSFFWAVFTRCCFDR